MASPSIIDLDAILGADFAAAADKVKYKKVKLFDREWRVSTSPNVFTALAGSMGDVDALVSMLGNIVHEDEQADFRKALLAKKGLDAEMLFKLINQLTEVAAERPTKSSTASSPASKKTAAVRRSAAG